MTDAGNNQQDIVGTRDAHVALLVDNDFLHRFGSVFQHALVGLTDQPVTVSVVCPDPQRLSDLTTGPAGLFPMRTGLWPWTERKNLDQLASTLSRRKVTVIHACCGSLAERARRLSAMLAVPYVVSVTGLLRRECYWRFDPERCRSLIAISDPIRQMLADLHRHDTDRIELLRPGCFVRGGGPVGHPHVSTIVAAGSFDRHSGFDTLLRALAELKRREVEFMAFLFGNGTMENGLRRWTEKAGLHGNVTILDALPNWSTVLGDTDIYVQPGPLYQLHSGPYEAMAHGCPIVSTPDSGFELIVDGHNGVLIPTGSHTQLADALEQLLADRDRLVAMSRGAIDHARKHLSLHHAIDQLTSLYDRAAAR